MLCLLGAVSVLAVAGCGDDTSTTTPTQTVEKDVPARSYSQKNRPRSPAPRTAKEKPTAQVPRTWQRALYESLDEAGQSAVTAKTTEAFAEGELRQWVADDRQCVEAPVFNDSGQRTGTVENCGHTVVLACVVGDRLTDYRQIISAVSGKLTDRTCSGGRLTDPNV
jgi:hypothetical protein